MGDTTTPKTTIDAARALLQVCDGAESRDDHGYNGSDAPFVRSLFERTWLTERQLASLHRLLKKYSVQLGTMGYDYETLVVPPPGPSTSKTGTVAAVPSLPRPLSLVGDGARGPLRPTAPSPLPIYAGPLTPPVAPMIEAPKRFAKVFTPAPLSPWTGSSLAYFDKTKAPRDQQIVALDKIDEAFAVGKRVVVLEMPVGGGKSLVQGAVLDHQVGLGGRVFWACPQKILQDQLEQDFPSPKLEVLKGRSNYRCALDMDRKCHDAPCTDERKGILPECVNLVGEHENMGQLIRGELPADRTICVYWQAVIKAIQAKATLFNFSSFLFQMRIGRFDKREMMLVDECHSIESALMGYVTVELTSRTLDVLDIEIDEPINTKLELMQWIEKKGLITKVANRIAMLEGDKEDVDQDDPFSAEGGKAELKALKELDLKLQHFMAYLDLTEWAVESVAYTDKRSGELHKKVTARPIFVKAFAKDLLFNHAGRALCVSATILDVGLWAENLGLTPDEVAYISVPCDFPVENRPLYLEYAGNLGHKYFEADINPTHPKYVMKVKQILSRHEGERGIIHTHSFKLSDILRKEIGSPRFLFQDTFDNNKKALLAEHARRTDSVIVAPAFHEGVDLKDDLARFAILCKVPWPDLTDKVIKERMNRDDRFYAWLTALKLVQSTGRCVRSRADWATTYIIDEGFKSFYGRNRQLLPGWFKDAIIMGAPDPARLRKV